VQDVDLEALLADLESDRVERKVSLANKSAIEEAICAFANDLPDHRRPGVVFVGVDDAGTPVNFDVTDKRLLELADIRSSGNILPLPDMTVQKRVLRGHPMAVVVVQPSDSTPVRLRGRVMIRVGPRRGVASPSEERRLSEKRRSHDLPFDSRPLTGTSLDDLDVDLFRNEYLANAVAPDVLAENHRSVAEQLCALRFASADQVPTPVGLLVAGRDPRAQIPGAYVQFARFDGTDLAAPVRDAKQVAGPLTQVLRETEELLRLNISTAVDLTSSTTEQRQPDYPLTALQQLLRNALMHRSYEATSAPVRVNWFHDRIEIHNPGGPYGQVTAENFGQPGLTDYRNPALAEAMYALGFVQRFGVGIAVARQALDGNGNPPLEYLREPTYVAAIVRSA
jgi:ATP-dependent DNA helicase RecG